MGAQARRPARCAPIAGPDMVVLRTPVHLRGENLTTVGEFTVGEGDRVPFVLSYGPSHLPRAGGIRRRCGADGHRKVLAGMDAQVPRASGRWSEAVMRSLITLKALTYEPTGGIVAAPTTSLPEQHRRQPQLGLSLLLAARRDADAARADERRLLRRGAAPGATGCCAPSPDGPSRCRSCTASRGERRLTEWEVPWLPGYENSAPVRIGNAAHEPLQLDVFGEVMDTLHQGRRGGLREQVRLGRADRAARSPRRNLARARPRHLGGAHRAACTSPIRR